MLNTTNEMDTMVFYGTNDNKKDMNGIHGMTKENDMKGMLDTTKVEDTKEILNTTNEKNVNDILDTKEMDTDANDTNGIDEVDAHEC